MTMRRKDRFDFKQFSICQEHAGMKVGTDSDLLGTLSAGGQNILDIGTGTGVLSLMLAQRYPEAKVTAIEIDENAVKDATLNFANSPFHQRITLHHQSFQDYLQETKNLSEKPIFDSVICNPPYFDKSLECPNESRTRARHTSSLPFPVLVKGAYDLLCEGGCFSVCIPKEVLEDFKTECLLAGFWLKDIYKIQSVPEKEAVRFVLVHRKGSMIEPKEHQFCMRNADRSRSSWYIELMRPFHKD